MTSTSDVKRRHLTASGYPRGTLPGRHSIRAVSLSMKQEVGAARQTGLKSRPADGGLLHTEMIYYQRENRRLNASSQSQSGRRQREFPTAWICWIVLHRWRFSSCCKTRHRRIFCSAGATILAGVAAVANV